MVATDRKYEILDRQTGKLARKIFVDEAIYEEELEKIFGRCWLMVAHESLVPNADDFFLSYMGEDSVIVTRDAEGKIHVLLNMCRHRGNRVMRADLGNSRNFLCSYHGWTFANDGSLNHVPGEEAAYYNALDAKDLGLIEARVDVYAGLIFACWDRKAPSLEDYLGDARYYLDNMFNRYDNGMVAYGPEKWISPVNWKTPIDNTSDHYHTPTTHMSAMLATSKVYGQPILQLDKRLRYPSGDHHAFVNGHMITFRDLEHPLSDDDYNSPRAAAEKERSAEETARRLGPRANLLLRQHSIFPNSMLGLMMAHPRGPLKTEFWGFDLVPKDAAISMRSLGSGSGPAALFTQDDIDNWNQVTMAGRGYMGRKVAADLSMGIGHTGLNEEFPGHLSERYVSESNQRHYYERWMEFMNADSWDDITIEPHTAHYEGTAGFHG